MYCGLLREKMDGITQEAKFFLLKYLQVYGVNWRVRVSVRDLDRSFGMNDRAVKSALECLIKEKYLVREKLSTGGRGRPKQSLSPGLSLMSLMKKCSALNTNNYHDSLVEKLLSTPVERRKKRQLPPANEASSGGGGVTAAAKTLTNTRKLLICVLLAKADRYGVVRDLSMSELVSLVGLSKEQLRWHLKILKESKYLIDYISGASIKGLKGRLKSIFILCLTGLDSNRIANRSRFQISSKALKLFENSVHLAYAVDAVNGSLEPPKFISTCIDQFTHWSSIYLIEKEDFESVIRSKNFFLGLDSLAGPNFRRLPLFICELATLLSTANLDFCQTESELEKDVAKIVKEEGLRRALRIDGAGSRSNSLRLLLLLSKIVLGLYREVEQIIKRLNNEDNEPHVVLSALYLLNSRNSVFIHVQSESIEDIDRDSRLKNYAPPPIS